MFTKKTFHIIHLGCAKNLYDAEVMTGALLRAGWRETEDPDGAEAILVNSCGFIEPAQEESINAAFEQISSNSDAAVVMTGCLAQRYPEELASDMPELAGVFGNRRPEDIPGFLQSLDQRRVYAPDGQPEWFGASSDRPRLYSAPGTAYVKIAEGCTHNCSFCAIPQIRGSLRSRPVEVIVEEIEGLLATGRREINLIAQDLSMLGLDKGERQFLPLLERISRLPGEFWIRLLYIYPERFPLELLELCKADPRILPYFDLPVQHAAESVLRAMGRPATPERTLETIHSIQETHPGATIRTTFLVGYPGEGEKEFQELLDFQQQARFDWMGAFVYSPQEGTKGWDLAQGDGAVPEDLAEERARLLYDAQEPITKERLSRFVGTRQRLLVEEPVEGEDLYFARGVMQAPEVDGTVVLYAPRGSLTPGTFCEAKVFDQDTYDLRARLSSSVRGNQAP